MDVTLRKHYDGPELFTILSLRCLHQIINSKNKPVVELNVLAYTLVHVQHYTYTLTYIYIIQHEYILDLTKIFRPCEFDHDSISTLSFKVNKWVLKRHVFGKISFLENFLLLKMCFGPPLFTPFFTLKLSVDKVLVKQSEYFFFAILWGTLWASVDACLRVRTY